MSEDVNVKLDKALAAVSEQTKVSKELSDVYRQKVPEIDQKVAQATGTLESHRQEIVTEVSSKVVLEADRATSAADSILVGSDIHPDVATGLAATAVNGYFKVIAPGASDLFELYKNVAGVATYQKSYPAVSSDRKLKTSRLDLFRDMNLVDPAKFETGGYYSNGSWVNNASFYSTGLTSVEAPGMLHWNTTELGKILSWYDSEGGFISEDTVRTPAAIPQNAKFFRITMRISEVPPEKLVIYKDFEVNVERYELNPNIQTPFLLSSEVNRKGGVPGLDENGKLSKDTIPFTTYQENLFDIHTMLGYGYPHHETGAWESSDDFYTSNFIPVTEGDVLTRSLPESTKNVIWYNAAGEFISGSRTPAPYTAPAGAAFARFVMRFSEVDPLSFRIARGETLVSLEVDDDSPFEATKRKDTPGGYLGLNSEGEYEREHSPELIKSVNLFSLHDYTVKAYPSTSNGTLITADDFYTSGFISVKPNTFYTRSGPGIRKNLAWYDESKQFISGATLEETNVSPINAAYLRICMRESEIVPEEFMVVEGTVLPDTYIAGGHMVKETSPFVGRNQANQPKGFPQLTSEGKLPLKVLPDSNNHPLRGKKIVGLGDSITYGFIPRNDPSGNYPGQMESYLPKIARHFESTYENFGISGSCVADRGGDNNAYVNRYDKLPDDADLIIVMGGTNDVRKGVSLGQWGDKTKDTFYGALYLLCEGLSNKYLYGENGDHNKQIVFMTAIKLSTTLNTKLPSFNQAVIETCEYFSIPVFDSYNMSGLTPHLFRTVKGWQDGYTDMYNPYITDGTHPTDAGNEIFARHIAGFLKTLY